jgi:hypothetical protein
MRISRRSIQACLMPVACFVTLWGYVPASTAQEPPRAGFVSVLDEACVDRRTEMCVLLADPDRATPIESTLREMCSTQACRISWYRTVVVPFGALGPLCVCERRKLVLAEGQRCAEGYKESPATGTDGKPRVACELPGPKMGPDGLWEWPSTPSDLMSCLRYARYGPGSISCRIWVPRPKAN